MKRAAISIGHQFSSIRITVTPDVLVHLHRWTQSCGGLYETNVLKVVRMPSSVHFYLDAL